MDSRSSGVVRTRSRGDAMADAGLCLTLCFRGSDILMW
jgi:hypothetical protein